MLRKKYFLSFFKLVEVSKKNGFHLFMYRKNKRWHLSHRVQDAEKLNILQLKWHYFLFRLYRRRNKRFFGYQHPFGIVKQNRLH